MYSEMWVSFILSTWYSTVFFALGVFITNENNMKEEAYDFYIFVQKIPWTILKGIVLGISLYGAFYTLLSLKTYLLVIPVLSFILGYFSSE